MATTLNFGKFVCEHPAFISGDFDTHFVKKYFRPEFLNDEEEEIAAALVALKYHIDQQKKLTIGKKSK